MQHFEASQIRRMPGLHLGKLQKENMTQTALVLLLLLVGLMKKMSKIFIFKYFYIIVEYCNIWN